MIFSRKDTNGIKGIAIILLLFHHCFVSENRFAEYNVVFPLLPELYVVHLAGLARVCVAIFTILSAYGMTVSYKKKGSIHPFQEYRHRLTKLIGNFIFIYGIIVIFGTAVMKDGRFAVYGTGIRRVIYIISDALGMAGLFHTPTYLFTWWYESLAIVIILILPVLILIYRKTGPYIILTLAFLFAVIVPVDNTAPYETLQIQNYLFSICFGMIMADRNWLARIREWKIDRTIRLLAEFVGIVAFSELNRIVSGLPYQALTECFSACCIICFGYELLSILPAIGNTFEILGLYSGNVYLIHNMLRSSWCGRFFYGFHYPALIVLVLLAASLLFAVAIAGLQKLLHYDRLIQRLATTTKS